LLIGASDLQRSFRESANLSSSNATTRSLDIDTLPASAIDTLPAWPCRVADPHATRSILRLIRRNEGATMPGLLALPRCEVAIPSATLGMYHRFQLVLDGDFIRVYLDGTTKPGILYPVSDSHMLRVLVDALPLFEKPIVYRDDTQRTPMLY
jgi:hypothetical protein